jgi:hypothetical protein
MVGRVEDDSPAKKAGIKSGDILLTYGEQKLFVRQQLAGLVEADHPGASVAIGLLRDGQEQTVMATLGEGEDSDRHAARSRLGRMLAALREQRQERRADDDADRPLDRLRAWFASRVEERERGADWERFESLTLKRVADDRFTLEFQHRHADNELAAHKFEGTRAEIRGAIVKEDHLSADERAHLLRSLDMPAAAVAARTGLLDRIRERLEQQNGGEGFFARWSQLLMPGGRVY